MEKSMHWRCWVLLHGESFWVCVMDAFSLIICIFVRCWLPLVYVRVSEHIFTMKCRAMRVSGIVGRGMAGVAWVTPTVQYMKANGAKANDVAKACFDFVSHVHRPFCRRTVICQLWTVIYLFFILSQHVHLLSNIIAILQENRISQLRTWLFAYLFKRKDSGSEGH